MKFHLNKRMLAIPTIDAVSEKSIMAKIVGEAKTSGVKSPPLFPVCSKAFHNTVGKASCSS